MNSAQKIIKYIAMGFAVFLMVTILSAILSVVGGVSDAKVFRSDVTYVSFIETFDDVRSLDLTNYDGEMNIQIGEGDAVIVEAKNVPDTVSAKMEKNGELVVENSSSFLIRINLFNWSNSKDADSVITITLPSDFVADKVTMDSNSGPVKIDQLKTKSLDIGSGSGKITAQNIYADKIDISTGSGGVEINQSTLSNGDISTGSGSVRITESALNKTQLSIGSGEFRFSGNMTGDNEIDGGSGSITLDITGDMNNYYIKCESGSGRLWLNGDKIEDSYKSGSKSLDNRLEIDGGSGRVVVNFN